MMKRTKLNFNLSSLISHLSSLKGFTLIELLVVILIIFSVGILIVSILFSALRGANKTNTIDLVRRNGNSAITQMSKMIRYSQSFDGVSIYGSTYTTCDGRPIVAVPGPSSIAKSPESSLQSFWANIIQGSINLGKKEVSGLFSKLAALIPKFGRGGSLLAQVAVAQASLSDLIITDFHLTDAAGATKISFTPGEAIYPWVTIKNQGSVTAFGSPDGYFYTSIYSNKPLAVAVGTSSDVNVWAKELDLIAAGASKTYSKIENFGNWTNDPGTPSNTSNWSKPAGSYTARAYVDSFGHVAESDGGANNQITSAYNVGVSTPTCATGPIVFDNKSTGPPQTGSSIASTHTVCAGSNRILIAHIGLNNNPNITVISASYGATPLTFAGSAAFSGTSTARSEIWYVPLGTSASSTTNTVTVNFSATAGAIALGVSSWANVSQTTPFGTFASASALSGTAISVNVTISTGQIVLDSVVSNPPGTAVLPVLTANAAQTDLFGAAEEGPNFSMRGSYRTGAAGTTPMSWTSSDITAPWAIFAIPLNPTTPPTPISTPTSTPVPATPTPAGPTATPTLTPVPTATPIPIQYHYAKVTGFDGGKTIFRCDKTVSFPSGIASISAATLVSVPLIDTNSVDVSDCYFTCSQDNIFSPPNIGIKFSLTQKGNPQFFENRDSASFQTSVSVRNY